MKARRTKSAEASLAPSLVSIIDWTLAPAEGRPVSVVLPGPQGRKEMVAHYSGGEWIKTQQGISLDTIAAADWLEIGVAASFLNRAARFVMPPESKQRTAPWFPHLAGVWEVLWALVAVEEFVIEEPLRSMVDQSFYLLHDMFKALWEARFLARENADLGVAEDFVQTLLRWLANATLTQKDVETLSSIGIRRSVTTDVERLDLICFLFTLAQQNALLSRAVLLFDDLESALGPEKKVLLKGLFELLETLRRWMRIGECPVGILIGFTGTRADLNILRKRSPKLAAEVESGVACARRALS